MEVKVKKEVLFNLLKKALNENRTFDNSSGNFIHAFDRQEAPIEATPHMATQLSVEEPPVADENYVPASIRELSAAASRIAEEVPPDQVERYYRSLHKLLDAVIDYLPSPLDVDSITGFDPDDSDKTMVRKPDVKEPFSALVFKIMTDPYVGRLTYLRVYSGRLEKGSYIYNPNVGKRERIVR